MGDLKIGHLEITRPGNFTSIECGKGATDNQFAFLDLVGDTTHTDYGARFIRFATGANAETQLVQ